MSDFLTRLVQRTLSPVTEMRPRLLSPFEAMPQQAEQRAGLGKIEATPGTLLPPATEWQTEGAIAERTPPSQAVLSPTPPGPAVVTGESHSSDVVTSSAPPTVTACREMQRPSETPCPTGTSVAGISRARDALPEGEDRGGETLSAPREAIQNPPKRLAAEPASSPPDSVRKPDLGVAATPSLPQLRPSDPDKSAVSISPHTLIEVHPVKQSVPPSPAGLSCEPQGSPSSQSLAAASPPPIHVTIGRVEVRAVPPVQPRPAVSPSPKVGLEEYLQSRKGARR